MNKGNQDIIALFCMTDKRDAAYRQKVGFSPSRLCASCRSKHYSLKEHMHKLLNTYAHHIYIMHKISHLIIFALGQSFTSSATACTSASEKLLLLKGL